MPVLCWALYHADFQCVMPPACGACLAVLGGMLCWAQGLPQPCRLRRFKRSVLITEMARVQSVAVATVLVAYELD